MEKGYLCRKTARSQTDLKTNKNKQTKNSITMNTEIIEMLELSDKNIKALW